MDDKQVLSRIKAVEIWDVDDERDVMVRSDKEIRLTTQKVILRDYLRGIKSNVVEFDLEKKKKDYLNRIMNKAALESKTLRERGITEDARHPDEIQFNDEDFHGA